MEVVGDVVARQAAARGDHPFLICDDDVLTFAELDARSAVVAGGLWAMGVGKGTHVGLLFPNGSDFVVAAVALARLGAVIVPLSTFSTRSELATLLAGADVELVLATPSHRGRDFVADLPDGARFSLPTGDPVEATVRPGDRLVLVHTSGSTSAPKGVLHQHGPLLEHMANLNRLRRLTADDVLLSPSPFFWIGGFAFSLLATLLAGATLVCSNSPDAGAVLDLIERTRPTVGNGFAASVAHLPDHPSFAARDLSSLRRGNLWPLMPVADPGLRHQLFGMSETGSVCLISDDESEQPEHRRGSFGRPAPGFEHRIVDGELWLRGPYLMEGYYGRERHEAFTPDGWFRTGDRFDEDGDGFLYFRGRTGDMIKTAGANVAPTEVEAAILDATGCVAHVVGLDDPVRGQVVAAAVRTASPLDEAALVAALRERLSAYKVPKRWLFLPDADVPMLSTGKLDAQALRALLQEEGT